MPIALFEMPDGRVAQFEVPEGTTPEQAQLMMEQAIASGATQGAGSSPPRPGIRNEAIRGGKQWLSDTLTSAGLVGGQESARRAATEGLARSEQIAAQHGETPWERVKKVYNDPKGGLMSAIGEGVSQMPAAIAAQAPQLAVTAGAAKLGAMGGGALAGPPGALVGGALAAGASMFPQFTGGAMQTQAQEDIRAKRPVDIDIPAALAAAAGSTALEVGGGALALGRSAVSKILGLPAKTIAEQSARAGAKLAVEAKRSLLGTAARGAGRGLAVEMPVEVAQTVLDRAQAGLSLVDDEAMAAYGDTLGATAMVAPALGGAGRIHSRSSARAQVEEQEKAARDAAELAAEQQAAAAEQQKEVQRKDPAYAQKVTADYDRLYAQHQAMLPGEPGQAATGADKLDIEAQQKAADDFYAANLKDLEVEAAAVRPTMRAMQDQVFKAAEEKANAEQSTKVGRAMGALPNTGLGDITQLIADRDVAYQQQAAATKMSQEAAAKGDIATARAALEQAAQHVQRAKVLDKQLAGRQPPSATTQVPPDQSQQIARLLKQYGVASQSGQEAQGKALLVELEKLQVAQKERDRLLGQMPTAWDEDTQEPGGRVKKTRPAAPEASEGPAPTTSLYPQEDVAEPAWRPKDTPVLDAAINLRGQPKDNMGMQEKYRKPGPTAQRVSDNKNTAPAPATQQENLFPEIGPGGTIPGVAPESELLQQIVTLRGRPNMSTQGQQALDNFERTLSNPALAQAAARNNILEAIRDQLDRMANLGEGARQQVDTRAGVKQVLADKQKELDAARAELQTFADKEPGIRAPKTQFQDKNTFAAARQRVARLKQEMADLAAQLAKTTSKEAVPVENRAVQPVWVPPADTGLTKAQQAQPTPTAADVSEQTPKEARTHAPGYTKVGEVGYVNVEPGTRQQISPVRTAASTATTDTVQATSGSKMPTVSTSTEVERRDRPNATSVRGKALTNAAEINETTLELTPEDQQSFDFWDSVYGVEAPAYSLVREAESALLRAENALGDIVQRRNQLAMAEAIARRAEAARNAGLRVDENTPTDATLPLQDEKNAAAIPAAQEKYQQAKTDAEAAAKDVAEAQAALDEVENRVTRLQDAEQYKSLVHYLKTDPAAAEAELDNALGTLTTLLSGDENVSPAEAQARAALASLTGAPVLTDADMQVYYKQRPAFEEVLGSHYADMFETVIRLQAALDVKGRVDAFNKERGKAQKKVQEATAAQAGKERQAQTALDAIPPRMSKVEVLRKRLEETKAKEVELQGEADAARKRLSDARALRKDVIDSAEDMRAGKRSKLELKQEALRQDIQRMSGDLQAISDSVDGINAGVANDVEALLKYPGAMQDLEARFDFLTSVLEGLEAQGVQSPRLETQQAGMVAATQRAERVKHERRVQALELKRAWWQRILQRATNENKPPEPEELVRDYRAFVAENPDVAGTVDAKDAMAREVRVLLAALKKSEGPDPAAKALREINTALKEIDAAITAERADYAARTDGSQRDMLTESAGMRNARAAEAGMRLQRDTLNKAYDELTERVRTVQQLTIPAKQREERGNLSRNVKVPVGTPAARAEATTPDYAGMQNKRGLLVALTSIDMQEQARLDAAIDAAGKRTAEERADFENSGRFALPESYFQAADAYDRAVIAKRAYMDARRAPGGIEARRVQLAQDIVALPTEEYQQLIESEAAGTPLEQPSAGLATVAKQLQRAAPRMTPRRDKLDEVSRDAAEKARADDPKNVTFQARLDALDDAGALRKIKGSLENQIADAVAARKVDPGERVPLPVRSPLPHKIMGRPSDARAKARLSLNEKKVADLQYRLDMVNDRLATLKKPRGAEPTLREVQGNVFEVFQAEMAAKAGRRGQGPVVGPERVAGDFLTGSKESRANPSPLKTGTRRRVQESGQPRQPTAKQAMREGNRAAAERAKAEADEARQAQEDAAEEKRQAAAAKRAAKGRVIPEEKGEKFGADMDGVASPAPRVSTDLSDASIEAIKDGRVLDVIDRLSSEGSTPEVREAAAKLKPFMLRTKLRTQADLKHKGERVAGMYYHDTNTVALDPDSLSEETLLHELTHAATMQALEMPDTNLTPDQRTAKADLMRLHKAIQKNPAFKGEYGTTDLAEFVAEAYSNPQLQAKLDTIGTPRSLWSRVKDLFARILGYGTDPKTPTSRKAKDAVEKLMMASRPKAGGTARAAPTTSSTGQYALSGMIAKKKPWKERMGGGLARLAEMSLVDMRAPARDALATGNKKLGEDAMYLLRKNDARMPQVYAVFQHGALGMRKDAKGRILVEAGNSKSVQDVFQAIEKIPGANAEERMEKAQIYLAAIRAQADPRAAFALSLGKVTPEQMAADLKKLTTEPKQKEALENVRKIYGDLNRGLIGFMEQTGAISKEDAARYTSSDAYVPFYRVRADGVAELVFDETKTVRLGDVRTQPYLKALEGGDGQMLPLNEAITRNVMLLTDMGMRNLTTRNVAYALQDIGKGAKKMQIKTGEGPADVKALRFKQDGNPYHVIVDTEGTAAEGIPSEMVARSLEGTYTVLPTFLKAFGYMGDVLRAGVTRSPLYVGRQLFRDPFAASFTGGLDRGPLSAVAKAMSTFAHQSANGPSKTAEAMIKKGIIQSGIFTGDPDDISKMSMQLAGNDTGAIRQLFNMADRAAMRADSVTREQVYEDTLRRTGSEQQAEMAAIEMMNFHKRGLSPSVQYASRLIPFFNAQIQGLNVLYKAATGKATMQERLNIQNKFWERASMLMAGSVIYALAMEDDETYKNARPQDRYSNWFAPLSKGATASEDATLKLPIPFEVGVLFKALPEAFIDMARGQFGAEEFKALRTVMLQQIPGYSSALLPQAVKPLIEVATNYSFFTGREIEGAGMQKLDPQERYTARTTELAKRLSELAPAGTGPSPVVIEHLARGFLGSLPLAAAALLNSVFEVPNAEKPARKLTETPLLGTAFQDRYGGGQVDILYAKIRAADQAKATYDKMLREGRKQDAKMYMADVENLRALPMLQQAETRLQQLSAQEKIVRNNTAASAERKREMLDNLAAKRESESRKFLTAVSAVSR